MKREREREEKRKKKEEEPWKRSKRVLSGLKKEGTINRVCVRERERENE